MSSKLTRVVTTRIPADKAGYTLVDYLTERYTYHTRDSWLEVIANGDMTLHEQALAHDYILCKDDPIIYKYEAPEEPKVDTNYQIIFEDEYLLVINKPGDLPMHPGGKFFNHTLWALLKQKYEKLHFINRIDRETSGLVLVALNPKTAATLAKQFQRRQVTKQYSVLVEGNFPNEIIRAKGYLAKDEESIFDKKKCFIAAENYSDYGKDGVFSTFEKISCCETSKTSLLKALIHTGKTHQIRASLLALGYPLVGDKMYGLDETVFLHFIKQQLNDDDRKLMRISRQALHAENLTFDHPHTQEEVKFTAPLPDDMQNLLKGKSTCI